MDPTDPSSWRRVQKCVTIGNVTLLISGLLMLENAWWRRAVFLILEAMNTSLSAKSPMTGNALCASYRLKILFRSKNAATGCVRSALEQFWGEHHWMLWLLKSCRLISWMSLIWRSSNFLPNFNDHHLHKIPHESVLSETEYLVLLSDSHDKEATAVVICQVHICFVSLYSY